MQTNSEQLRKPSEFTEDMVLSAILDNTFPAGTSLPSERRFAEKIGVTRPTLRETLQRLGREGWVTIRHGKPTIVNDFWKNGGLGMLGTMARFAEFLPEGFIQHLLQVRMLLLPSCAQAAADNRPDLLLAHLEKTEDIIDHAERFPAYDWDLQLLFVQHSGNLIIPLMFNDFTEIYHKMAGGYFALEKARISSLKFYRDLKTILQDGGKGVDMIVKKVMKESVEIWREINFSNSIKGL